MLVDGAETSQEIAEVLRAHGHGQNGTHGGVHGVTATNPVPETESVLGVNAELGYLVQSGGHGHEVLSDSTLGGDALGL